MKRRHFLTRSIAAGAGTLLTAHAGWASAIPSAPAPAFQMLRRRGEDGGYVPLSACTADTCLADTLDVALDGFHPATDAPALARLAVSALFDVVGAAQVPYHVWHVDAGDPSRTTRRFRFRAGRSTMRGFRVDYQLAGSTAGAGERAHCAVVAHPGGLLQPGDYVLISPRRDGQPVAPGHLAFSGDAAQPLGPGPRDFDYLALRVLAPMERDDTADA